MNKEIKGLGEQANKIELLLYEKVINLDNHMNQCDCDDSVEYSFYNIKGHYETYIFCLNCGGIISNGR